MNEKLVFRFMQNGVPLPVQQLISVAMDRGGIVLNDETSAWPMAVRFDLEGVGGSKKVLQDLRNQQSDGNHRFAVAVENGALSFQTIAPDRIPIGTYDYSLRVADLELESRTGRVSFSSTQAVAAVDVEVEPDKRVATVTAATLAADAAFQPLLNGPSTLDGRPLGNWLFDAPARSKRKACLLNIAATLSVSPATAPLLPFITNIFFADVDRIYAEVDAALLTRLQALDSSAARPFRLDHGPLDATHQKLLRRVPPRDQDLTEEYRKNMKSFRQDAKPSMQIVVFSPPAGQPGRASYADIDIDLGNPTRDVAGFFVHLGELIAEGQTDHLKMHRTLVKNPRLAPHLHYFVV
jgi:hypothetical protein